MTSQTLAAANPKATAQPQAGNQNRTDRECFGRIVGHLHMAGRTLLEGKITRSKK